MKVHRSNASKTTYVFADTDPRWVMALQHLDVAPPSARGSRATSSAFPVPVFLSSLFPCCFIFCATSSSLPVPVLVFFYFLRGLIVSGHNTW